MKQTLRVAAAVLLLMAARIIAQASPKLNSTAIANILAATPSCAVSHIHLNSHLCILGSALDNMNLVPMSMDHQTKARHLGTVVD